MLIAPSTYPGILRRSRRRMSAFDVPRGLGSSGPSTNDGLTITTGSPLAAVRIATSSASCFELMYATPRRPTVNGLSSSIVSPGLAAPTALELEVRTARSTPALRASSKTFLVPSTFTSKTRIRSRVRIEVVPATWKTRPTSLIALRTESRSVTSPIARSYSIPSSGSRLLVSRTRRRSSSPRRASSLATWRPTKPVPPVTSVFAIGSHARTLRCPRPRWSPIRPPTSRLS